MNMALHADDKDTCSSQAPRLRLGGRPVFHGLPLPLGHVIYTAIVPGLIVTNVIVG